MKLQPSANIRKKEMLDPFKQRQIDEPSPNPDAKKLSQATILQLQKVIGNQAVSQLMKAQLQSATPIQMVKWPAKKQQGTIMSSASASLWKDEDSDSIQELYEWCTNVSQFNKLIASIDSTYWNQNHSFISETDRQSFDQMIVESSELKPVFDYFRLKKAKVRELKQFDESTYTFPSKYLQDVMTAKGIVDQDLQAPGLKSYFGNLQLLDQNLEKQQYEKIENSGVLTLDERVAKNEAIHELVGQIQVSIDEISTEKAKLEAKAKADAKHKADVQSMVVLASKLPSFNGVTGNAIANAVWNASVAGAGKVGFIELDKQIYKKADVTTATALLRTFSLAWTSKYADGQFLENPHTPGGGNVQDKTGHSSEDARTSQYQADFIATWGGSKIVVHINADSV